MRFRLPRLYGAEGESEDDANDSDNDSTNQNEAKTLTSEELERSLARAADRASRGATKALAKELGFEKVSDLKDWALKQKEAAEASRSEEEKRAAKLAEDQAKADSERAKVRHERLELNIEKAVVRAGVTDEKKLNRLLTLMAAEIEEDSEDDWDTQIAAALEAVKSDVPELFSSKAPSHGSGDGGTDGPSVPPDTNEEDEQTKAWKQEYAQRGLVEADFGSI